MNWGHGILVVIILFVLGISGMVYLSSRQRIEMMDDHYYERESVHQSLIDGEENLIRIGGNIRIIDSMSFIAITISEKVVDKISNGKMNFLRPSDQRLDKLIQFKPEMGKQLIEKSNFVKGEYVVRLSWVNDGIFYYKEMPITII